MRQRIGSELPSRTAAGSRVTGVRHGEKAIRDFQQVGHELVYAAEVTPGETPVTSPDQ